MRVVFPLTEPGAALHLLAWARSSVDAAALEKARDLHCEALTAAVSRTAALDMLTLAQGVYTSAFSGFEDRLREFRSVANVPPKVDAIAEVDDRPRGFDTGLFERDAT